METGNKTENEMIFDSRNWGNYNNSTGNATINSGTSNMNFTTGRSEYWKANNIYDLAGSPYEITQEISLGINVLRGGLNWDFGGDYVSAGGRDYTNNYDAFGGASYVSFRIQIFINV